MDSSKMTRFGPIALASKSSDKGNRRLNPIRAKTARSGCIRDKNPGSKKRGQFACVAAAAIIFAVVLFPRINTADDWEHFKRATQSYDATENGNLYLQITDEATTNLWLPPARNVHPRRRKPRPDWPLLYRQLYCYSYPASPPLQSILNPWGEQVPIFRGPIEQLPRRILAACEVYRYQNVHFDGYLGSEDDGRHLFAAADGKNIAWFGDNITKTYRMVPQSLTDTLDERCWICVDLPIFVLNLAGFPIRQAMIAHFLEAPEIYTENGRFPDNVPIDVFFFRRVENLRRYFRYKQFYSQDCVTIEQYFDKDYRPPEPFRPGDVIFMGHYKSKDDKGPFEAAKHSGIVETVDERGMPVRIYNMRTSNRLTDRYDGIIEQTRIIKGRPVYFRRFCDRYSIIGHGRIVRPFEYPDRMPTIDMVRAFLAKRREQQVADRQTTCSVASGSLTGTSTDVENDCPE